MVEIKYQIFVSSTYLDLKDERLKAQSAILRLGHIPLGMELFPASQGLWEIIENQIKSCDYYILIIGGAYGTVEETGKSKGISFTELEYRLALKYRVPILPFVRKDIKRHGSYIDAKPLMRKGVDNFIKKLKDENLSLNYWASPAELESEISSALSNKIRQEERPGWQKRHLPVFSRSVKKHLFECYYYSFVHHRPHKFDLTLGIEQDGCIKVEESGFHEGVNAHVKYKGTGFNNNGYLHLSLKGDSGDMLSLVFILGGHEDSLKNISIMFGHLQGISSYNVTDPYLANCEIVAIKKTKKKGHAIEAEHLTLIKRFLMINRVTYRVKSRQLNSPIDWKNLEGRGISLASLQHLIGVYRVLIPIRRDVFIQSRLEIDEHFVSHFYTKNVPAYPTLFPEKQVCLLRSSTFPENTGKINLTMHEENGVRVVSNIMIDLPMIDTMDEVFIGSYCNAGKPIDKSSKLKKDNSKRQGGTSYRRLGSKSGFFLSVLCTKPEETQFALGEVPLTSLKSEEKHNPAIGDLVWVYSKKRDTLFFNPSPYHPS